MHSRQRTSLSTNPFCRFGRFDLQCCGDDRPTVDGRRSAASINLHACPFSHLSRRLKDGHIFRGHEMSRMLTAINLAIGRRQLDRIRFPAVKLFFRYPFLSNHSLCEIECRLSISPSIAADCLFDVALVLLRVTAFIVPFRTRRRSWRWKSLSRGSDFRL
jgi:hypothetical protein